MTHANIQRSQKRCFGGISSQLQEELLSKSDVVGMYDRKGAHLNNFIGIIAEDPPRGRTDIDGSGLTVQHSDNVIAILDQSAESFLAMAEGLFGKRAFGDIENRTVEVQGLAV